MLVRVIVSLLLLIAMSGCQGCEIKKENSNDSAWTDALSFAEKNLSHEGSLVQKPDGFAYIKVDDRYIHDLFPMLKVAGFEKPPYFRREDAPGAHISVFYEDEHVKASEVGQKFSFTVSGLKVVTTHKKVSYIVLQVKAPELEQLRRKYGLNSLLNNNEFHITLARKVDR